MNIQKYLDLFEYQKDEESTNPRFVEGFWSFKNAVCKGHPVNDSWQDCPTCMLQTPLSDLIHSSDLDQDSAYTFTVEALQAMQDQGEVTAKHELEDISQYAEAPVYNSELTEWMAKGTNYTYVEEALNELGWDNSSLIATISYAYTNAWKEHYFKVLEIVRGK